MSESNDQRVSDHMKLALGAVGAFALFVVGLIATELSQMARLEQLRNYQQTMATTLERIDDRLRKLERWQARQDGKKSGGTR